VEPVLIEEDKTMEFKHSKDMPLGDGKPCENPWMPDTLLCDGRYYTHIRFNDISREDMEERARKYEEKGVLVIATYLDIQRRGAVVVCTDIEFYGETGGDCCL
jgi:hypothetical protein